MLMPGRKWSSGSYRYGFNGKENDNEVKGEGNQQDYGMRISDPRLGRFLSVDPLTKSYPFYTPYAFAGNKPIWAIDLDGLEEYTLSDFGSGRVDLLAYLNSKFTGFWEGEGTARNVVNSFNRNINPVGLVYYNGYQFITGTDADTKQPASRVDALGNIVIAGIFHQATTKLTAPSAAAKMEQQMAQNTVKGEAGVKSSTSNATTEQATKANGGNTNAVVVDAAAQTVSKTAVRRAYAERIFKSAGKSEDDIASLMKTINFSKPVKSRDLNVGDRIWRFEKINGKEGERHFFTDAYGADAGPTSVGFYDASGYKLVTYEVTKQTRVMESEIRNTKTKQFFSTELQDNIKKIGEE